MRSAAARHPCHTSQGILATNRKSISSLPYDPGVSRPTQWSKSASSSEIRAALGLLGNMATFRISVRMDRSVSQEGYCLSTATNTSANLADLVTICLTCFSKYLVLQHCNSRSHYTQPLMWVWPVILRNRPKFYANSLRFLSVNSGKFTTI